MYVRWKSFPTFPSSNNKWKIFFFMIFIEKHITFYVVKCVFWVSSRNSGGECILNNDALSASNRKFWSRIVIREYDVVLGGCSIYNSSFTFSNFNTLFVRTYISCNINSTELENNVCMLAFHTPLRVNVILWICDAENYLWIKFSRNIYA